MPDTDPASGEEEVRETLVRFLEEEVGSLWPGTRGPLAASPGTRCGTTQGRVGPDRLDAQYLRANLDPSDRYVQSLPGSGRYRIAPGATGFDNLVVAGDWTACGWDAGSMEAATRSGVLAARAVLAGTAERSSTTGRAFRVTSGRDGIATWLGHLVGEVQRFGLLSAAAVVDRYVEIVNREKVRHPLADVAAEARRWHRGGWGWCRRDAPSGAPRLSTRRPGWCSRTRSRQKPRPSCCPEPAGSRRRGVGVGAQPHVVASWRPSSCGPRC